VMSVIACVLQAFGYYYEGDFHPNHAYVYITIIINVSVFLSIYFLVLFYLSIRHVLAEYKPIPKFICIKAILFFSFWQSVLIAVLSYFGVIHELDGWSSKDIARELQDTLICAEMFLLSVAHIFVFSHRPYAIKHSHWWSNPTNAGIAITAPVTNFISHVVNQNDLVGDFVTAYSPQNFKDAKVEHDSLLKEYMNELQQEALSQEEPSVAVDLDVLSEDSSVVPIDEGDVWKSSQTDLL